MFRTELNREPFNLFLSRFKQVFDHSAEGKAVSEQLMSLKQGSHRVSEYTLDFRILAAESGWNSTSLQAVFHQGLHTRVRKELACRDEDITLDALIDLAICMDSLLCDRSYEHEQAQDHFLNKSPVNMPEPMQIVRTRLSMAEKTRRRAQGLHKVFTAVITRT